MDRAIIDNVLERTNIIEVIGSYFPLNKAGANYKALCPFHEEKTPSFLVSERKQIYKCFGCGKSGNAISFVMDYEKVSFWEALKKLAARVGITLEETRTDKKKQTRQELIYHIYALARDHYRQNLQLHGQFARNYLKQRDISEETSSHFDLGFALDSFGALKNYLLKNSINEKIMLKSGLFSQGDRGLYDVFRNRLMFPIHSVTGQVVAFGGRNLQDDQKGGKYINSPTTDIYTKGNELYGLHITRFNIQKIDLAIICEGYTDFLRLYEYGYQHIAASLGTALTDAQIGLISRFTQNFLILYDGDEAGIQAAVRAAGNLIVKGLQARIVSLPEKDDPDSFLLREGKDKLDELISQALFLPVFLRDSKLVKLSNKGKIDILLDVLNRMKDPIARELFAKDIADTYQISENSILAKIRPAQDKTAKLAPNSDILRYQEERDLLKAVMQNSEDLKKVAQELDSSYFLFKIYRDIYNIIIEYADGMTQISGLLNEIEDELLKSTLAEMLIEDQPQLPVEEIIKTVKLRKYQNDLVEITREINRAGYLPELMAQKQMLKKQILQLKSKVVSRTLY